MPRTVKVLGSRYRVSERANLRVAGDAIASQVYAGDWVHEHDVEVGIPVLGYTDTDMGLIGIETEQSEDKFRVTYLHEVLHAIVAEAGLKDVIDSNQEERIVKRLAPLLRQVLKDNPRVLAFITGRYVQ